MTVAVMYRWTLKPGAEAQLREGWIRGTRAIHERCGSFGARLHRGPDGTRISYALWPDDATRKRCFDEEEFVGEGFEEMRAAVDTFLGEEVLEMLDDELQQPASDSS